MFSRLLWPACPTSRLKLTLIRPSFAVTGALFRQRQLVLFSALSRFNSTGRPPFPFQSALKFVDPPAPTWSIGDGLSNNASRWREEIMTSERESWDLTNPETSRESYRILTSAIVPRPIAFVSTLSKNGEPNLAPFRFVSLLLFWVSHNPPLLSISFSLSTRRPKDTRNNILATNEFTVNIISEAFAEAANATSVESPANTDEWIISGLNKEQSTLVKPPFVRESAISMECEMYSFQDITPPSSVEPTTTMVLGSIKKIHVRKSVLSEDGMTVDPVKLRPISRLGGLSYGRLLEAFDLPRPSWKAMRDEYKNLPRQDASDELQSRSSPNAPQNCERST
ncbi:hypothetical protein GALMADRAFT_97726 [Galerina marginata CBS 339.88]|uniref:Flavin reductase like domain-containing protein n=1 Tax=Galerina marginata (strain CBS 339.88) TaxID=685588 RepID=A0A067T7B5_GALM3|nr:hypothetical protein GALMADRAFT_97726 [Galerina marginata CBS 339.88]